MADDIEYAFLAGSAYIQTRDPVNRIPPPQGWSRIDYQPPTASGFEAVAYSNGTEVVISFAGTYPTDFQGDWMANVGLAYFGVVADQLKDAALFYERVKNSAAVADPNRISFTGHSLGGGLAALMGVFFNKKAVTFDPATKGTGVDFFSLT